MKRLAFFEEIRVTRLATWLACISLLLIAESVFAGSNQTLGSMASNIVKSFTAVTKLITAGSYIAGLGFSIGAIMKFKQHKDNPTQIPIGTPISLTLIAGALLFMPTILSVTGATMFGAGGGKTAGPLGSVFTSGS